MVQSALNAKSSFHLSTRLSGMSSTSLDSKIVACSVKRKVFRSGHRTFKRTFCHAGAAIR